MHILASNKFLILHSLTAECRIHQMEIFYSKSSIKIVGDFITIGITQLTCDL